MKGLCSRGKNVESCEILEANSLFIVHNIYLFKCISIIGEPERLKNP